MPGFVREDKGQKPLSITGWIHIKIKDRHRKKIDGALSGEWQRAC